MVPKITGWEEIWRVASIYARDFADGAADRAAHVAAAHRSGLAARKTRFGQPLWHLLAEHASKWAAAWGAAEDVSRVDGVGATR